MCADVTCVPSSPVLTHKTSLAYFSCFPWRAVWTTNSENIWKPCVEDHSPDPQHPVDVKTTCRKLHEQNINVAQGPVRVYLIPWPAYPNTFLHVSEEALITNHLMSVGAKQHKGENMRVGGKILQREPNDTSLNK